MEDIISKDVAFVNGWLVQQRLQKLHVCIFRYLLKSAANEIVGQEACYHDLNNSVFLIYSE